MIVSEKKDRKAARYLVRDLPFPYTSRAQFERRMEVPLGMEWNTRRGFQRGTMPRVTKTVRAHPRAACAGRATDAWRRCAALDRHDYRPHGEALLTAVTRPLGPWCCPALRDANATPPPSVLRCGVPGLPGPFSHVDYARYGTRSFTLLCPSPELSKMFFSCARADALAGSRPGIGADVGVVRVR